MRLLYCPVCYDIVSLLVGNTRHCGCQKSWGKYSSASLETTYGGKGLALVIDNNTLPKANTDHIARLIAYSIPTDMHEVPESWADKPTYLCSPYSHEDKVIMIQRWEKVCEIAAALMRRDIFIYSPIAHNHPCAQYGLPLTWEFWKPYDSCFIALSKKVLIADIPGHKESTGVNAEIIIAKKLDIPIGMVNHLTYEEYDYVG